MSFSVDIFQHLPGHLLIVTTTQVGKKKLKNQVNTSHAARNLLGSFLPEFDQGCPPPSASITGQFEFLYFWQPAQYGMNCAAQIADAFAVDDSHLKNICLTALLQVIREQIFKILWGKIVQVKDAVNGHFNYAIISSIRCISHGESSLLPPSPWLILPPVWRLLVHLIVR